MIGKRFESIEEIKSLWKKVRINLDHFVIQSFTNFGMFMSLIRYLVKQFVNWGKTFLTSTEPVKDTAKPGRRASLSKFQKNVIWFARFKICLQTKCRAQCHYTLKILQVSFNCSQMWRDGYPQVLQTNGGCTNQQFSGKNSR